ncbi:MAG: hypothetical protein ABFD76_05010 [Smithella sp.]
MRGTIAKKIRKSVYGDKPCNRGKRKYAHVQPETGPSRRNRGRKDYGHVRPFHNGDTIIAHGERRAYQDMKKELRESK